MVAALDNGLIAFVGLKNMEITAVKDLELKSSVTSLMVLPDDSKAVLGLVKGRCSIEVINGPSSDSFRFKCHRESPGLFKDRSMSICYSVNAIGYCPANELLVTAGSDNKIFTWNIPTKQRMQTLQFENGVQTTGMHLAVKSGTRGTVLVSVADRDSDLYGVRESCQSSQICVSINK